jgi:hypothetical protein
MEEIPVNSWEEFQKELGHLREKLRTSPDADPSYDLLFRGQENSCWPLTTTLDRRRERMLFHDYYRMISKIRPQVESLMGKEWPILGYPKVKKLCETYAFNDVLWCGRCPGYAYMAYLRHHGFPSPLLDWSRSPYVAAFFAFNKAPEESDRRLAIHVLSRCRFKVMGNEMRVVYFQGPFVRTHRRHVLQQSEYTLCVTYADQWYFEQYEAVFDQGNRRQALCYKFTIPATERPKVLREFDQYNLNPFSLFESEDSLMETLTAREFTFADKGVIAASTGATE